jgi:hypothetical protein
MNIFKKCWFHQLFFVNILQNIATFFSIYLGFFRDFQKCSNIFKEMIVHQLFFVNILKMLQYFLEMLDNTFSRKKSTFWLIFREHFCKMLHQFLHDTFTNIFCKKSQKRWAREGTLAPAGGRRARAKLWQCPASTARQPCELPRMRSPPAMARRGARATAMRIDREELQRARGRPRRATPVAEAGHGGRRARGGWRRVVASGVGLWGRRRWC